MAGELLARAGILRYEHVLFFPSYGPAMRGGVSTCIVILSNSNIASPVLPSAEAVIVAENSQIKPFENRVRPGGLLLLEAAGAQGKVTRKDIEVRCVPAIEAALSLGDVQVANLILLGGYIEAIKAVPLELIEKELEVRFGARERMLSLNKQALRQGARLMANYKA